MAAAATGGCSLTPVIIISQLGSLLTKLKHFASCQLAGIAARISLLSLSVHFNTFEWTTSRTSIPQAQLHLSLPLPCLSLSLLGHKNFAKFSHAVGPAKSTTKLSTLRHLLVLGAYFAELLLQSWSRSRSWSWNWWRVNSN